MINRVKDIKYWLPNWNLETITNFWQYLLHTFLAEIQPIISVLFGLFTTEPKCSLRTYHQ